MENRNVGWLLVGISILIFFIVFLFGNAQKDVLDNSCPIIQGGHEYCPAYKAINEISYLSFSLVGLIAIIGIVLVFSKPDERIREKTIIREVEKKIPEKKFEISDLNKNERIVLEIVKNDKAIFQAELGEKSGMHKVALTRILDRLENRGFIERKRRGMNNIVVWRH